MPLKLNSRAQPPLRVRGQLDLMTKKHPLQAYIEQQEAEEHQREEAEAEEKRRLERLKEAWTVVSPSVAEAVARANEALTPYTDELFFFSYFDQTTPRPSRSFTGGSMKFRSNAILSRTSRSTFPPRRTACRPTNATAMSRRGPPM